MGKCGVVGPSPLSLHEFAEQINLGIFPKQTLVLLCHMDLRQKLPLESSLLAHQAFTLPLTTAFAFSCYAHPQVIFFFSVCLYNILPSCGKRFPALQMAWAANGLLGLAPLSPGPVWSALKGSLVSS